MCGGMNIGLNRVKTKVKESPFLLDLVTRFYIFLIKSI